MVDIGKVIQEHLEMKDMTQTDLGNKIGLTQKAVSKYVTGKSQPPLDILEKILISLDINPFEIFEISSNSSCNKIRTKDEQILLNTYRSFNPDNKKVIIDIISTLQKALK